LSLVKNINVACLIDLCLNVCYWLCATELRNETSHINIRRSCLQTRAGNLSHHCDATVDKILIFCTDIILLHMFIINEKIPTYQTPLSPGNIVPVIYFQVCSSVPVTYYTFDL